MKLFEFQKEDMMNNRVQVWMSRENFSRLKLLSTGKQLEILLTGLEIFLTGGGMLLPAEQETRSCLVRRERWQDIFTALSVDIQSAWENNANVMNERIQVWMSRENFTRLKVAMTGERLKLFLSASWFGPRALHGELPHEIGKEKGKEKILSWQDISWQDIFDIFTALSVDIQSAWENNANYMEECK